MNVDIAVCNTELKSPTGVIESPNFPHAYPHNSNCTWTIVAPLGNRINLTFSHFSIESEGSENISCSYDFVEVPFTFCLTRVKTEEGKR